MRSTLQLTSIILLNIHPKVNHFIVPSHLLCRWTYEHMSDVPHVFPHQATHQDM